MGGVQPSREILEILLLLILPLLLLLLPLLWLYLMLVLTLYLFVVSNVPHRLLKVTDEFVWVGWWGVQ